MQHREPVKKIQKHTRSNDYIDSRRETESLVSHMDAVVCDYGNLTDISQ